MFAAVSVLAIVGLVYPPHDSDLVGFRIPCEHGIACDVSCFDAKFSYVPRSALKDVVVSRNSPNVVPLLAISNGNQVGPIYVERQRPFCTLWRYVGGKRYGNFARRNLEPKIIGQRLVP